MATRVDTLTSILRGKISDFPEYQSDIFLGDNTTKKFSAKFYPVLELSDTLLVGAAAKVRATDYAVDNESGLITLGTAPIDEIKVTFAYQYTAFSNARLAQELTVALSRHNRFYSWDSLPIWEELFVVKLAWIQLCYILAYDSAKYYGASLDGISFDKGVRVQHYLQLAQQLEAEYAADIDKYDLTADRTGDIFVGNLVRISRRTETMVPYGQVLPPLSPNLYVTQVTSTTAKIEWTECQARDFWKYDLYFVADTYGESLTTVPKSTVETYAPQYIIDPYLNHYHITGLTPATTYKVAVRLTLRGVYRVDVLNVLSPIVSFTTSAA